MARLARSQAPEAVEAALRRLEVLVGWAVAMDRRALRSKAAMGMPGQDPLNRWDQAPAAEPATLVAAVAQEMARVLVAAGAASSDSTSLVLLRFQVEVGSPQVPV
jgi:hypothetical protein